MSICFLKLAFTYLFFLLVQLGVPEAAIFKVGKFQEHPDIPDCLSIDAKSFLLGSATAVVCFFNVHVEITIYMYTAWVHPRTVQ